MAKSNYKLPYTLFRLIRYRNFARTVVILNISLVR